MFLALGNEAKKGAWQNGVTLVGGRTKAKPGGRRILVELKGWRAEVQQEA